MALAPEAGGKLEKIMIYTAGSRGDVQPYVALALELQKAGYCVCLATHSDFKGLVTGEFGIQHRGVLCAVQEELQRNEKLLKSMCKGDTFEFVRGVSDMQKKFADRQVEWLLEALDDFKPDLVIAKTMADLIFHLAIHKERIPAIVIDLSGEVSIPPGKRPAVGLPNLHCSFLNSCLHRLVCKLLYDILLLNNGALQRLRGYKVEDAVTKRDFVHDIYHPPVPLLIAQSQLFHELLHGEAEVPEGISYIGGLVVPPEAQLEKSSKGDKELSHFGLPGEMQRLREFLAAGTPPIYMGWGSMICHSPEYMLQLVLEALQHSGLRAVILGGWAKLRLELLDHDQHPELYKYAAQNTHFIQAAPHEWLFPQCSLVVHHGGTGTLQAGLRAGIPTVVTPVFLDQFGAAFAVNRLGVGIGLRQFQKLKATELGEALRKASIDKSMAEKAIEVAARLKMDNGNRKAVEEVESFWRDHVQTGRLAAFVEERRSQRQRRRPPPRLAALALCCGR